MENKFSLVLISIIVGIIISSIIFGAILYSHEMGHRNFEYVQCNQFWELADQYIQSDYEAFDCELILEHGVLEFKMSESRIADNLARDRIKTKHHAYQDYVDALRDK